MTRADPVTALDGPHPLTDLTVSAAGGEHRYVAGLARAEPPHLEYSTLHLLLHAVM